ncbi:MAG: PIN domain-containing protein [Chloroflexi bacterium]|nr:PIN domain-containing protein [Chloroflexota bacterium]
MAERMVRTQVYLPRRVYDGLQARAEQDRGTMAEHIRAALSNYLLWYDELDEWEPLDLDSLFDIIERPGGAGVEDAAENHDKYIYGDPHGERSLQAGGASVPPERFPELAVSEPPPAYPVHVRIFADTAGWVALFNPRDKYHSQAKQGLRAEDRAGINFVTSDYVLDETITNLGYTVSHVTAVRFADWVLGQKRIEVAHITEALWKEALVMFKRYDDKGFSFTDCVSFVVMQQRAIYDAFTFDHHFRQMGFRLWP